VGTGSAPTSRADGGQTHIASLCVAVDIPPLQLSRFMGHAKMTTTLSIYTHLFEDDHAETMAALEVMSRPIDSPNVMPIRRRS
jgi:hypothetical protein